MSTNILDLENDIKNNNIHGIYVFYGEEKYLQEEYLKKIKKMFGKLDVGINYILLDEDSINSLISDIETPAFGYEKKLIIIKNSGLFKKDSKSPYKDKIKTYINENIDIINNYCVIVFIEEIVHKMDFYKTIEKLSIVIETKTMKLPEIKARLKKICFLYKVNINNKELDYLIEISGTNMQNLINEIRKLIEYTGENGEITQDSIDKLCIKDIQAIIFDLTDFIGNRDIRNALEVLNNLIYNREPLQKIMITLYNHLKKLYLTKLAINESKDLVQVLELKPNQVFLIGKYKKQSGCFTENALIDLLEKLIKLDYNSKNGLMDIDIGLKSIISSIT